MLSQYLTAFCAGRFADTYQHLSTPNKARIPLDDFITKNAMKYPLLRPFLGSTSHQITHLSLRGETATARVTLSVPDLALTTKDSLLVAMLALAVGLRASSEEQPEPPPEASTRFPEQSRSGPALRQTFTLVKEEEAWKVFLALQ